MTVWIFLPAFNEAETLPQLLPKIARAAKDASFAYRLVLVDDGSTDDTAIIAAKFASRMPLDLIRHPLNRGLGETERDGFEHIVQRCVPDDVVVRLDCDDTHEPEYIPSLIATLREGYDVVGTSRFRPGGGQIGLDRYRSLVSRAANLFMHLLFRIPGVKDYSCGFRAYRASALISAVGVFGNNFLQLRGLGFTSTLETVVKLNLLGCRFAEVPFVLRYDQKRSASKMVGSITTLGYFVMAVLHYWPWGGWLRHYRGLAALYRSDPDQAVSRFGTGERRRSAASTLGF